MLWAIEGVFFGDVLLGEFRQLNHFWNNLSKFPVEYIRKPSPAMCG